MTTPAGSSRHPLDGKGLLIPRLQAEPFPLQLVEPSPCTRACPAGINVKSYVSLIAEGHFTKALEVVREHCPLPAVCGRICHHPCEAACKRAEIDEPVAIRALKRFVADLARDQTAPDPTPAPPDKAESVAVVGSGPAGLTAAYDLRRAGYPVTVFESEPEAGGMLRYGIADYRLPTNVLDAEIAYLVSAGIDIETDCRIGADRTLEDLLAGGYTALLLAVGAQRGRGLSVDGVEGCTDVVDALAFLRRVNAGDRTPLPGTVLVIGGGSTAIEAARTALRLGASRVEIVYRRHRGEMPADDEEIAQATAEGIRFRLLTAPQRVVSRNGKLEGLECLEVALGEPDASGRRRPIPIPGSEFLVAGDHVLTAIGQEAALEFLPARVVERLTNRGLLAVHGTTSMTALRGVFAAGDVATGPATVIDAIAAGHEAAAAIKRFLETGEPARRSEQPQPLQPEYEIPSPAPASSARRHPEHHAIAAGHEFDEVEVAFAPDDAIAEAQRCLRCGPCSECLICAPSCRRRHLSLLSVGDSEERTSLLLRAPARVAAGLEHGAAEVRLLTSAEDPTAAEGAFEIVPARVTVEEDNCRGCARCLEVCSFGAIRLIENGEAAQVARVEPALCRGCNLCSAVCPTDAVLPASFAPGWWGERIEDLYPSLLSGPTGREVTVVLACQRRAAAVEAQLAGAGLAPASSEVVPVRCAGQLDAGTLLELYRHGAARVLVAGCVSGSCRYGLGPQLAAGQVLRANSVLRELGTTAEVLAADWAADAGSEIVVLTDTAAFTPHASGEH